MASCLDLVSRRNFPLLTRPSLPYNLMLLDEDRYPLQLQLLSPAIFSDGADQKEYAIVHQMLNLNWAHILDPYQSGREQNFR